MKMRVWKLSLVKINQYKLYLKLKKTPYTKYLQLLNRQ